MKDDEEEGEKMAIGRSTRKYKEEEQTKFLLDGTSINYREAKKQIDLQMKYITQLRSVLEMYADDDNWGKQYWIWIGNREHPSTIAKQVLEEK